MTFLALLVPTVLGLEAATLAFCPPDFLASFSALTFSSAYVLSMVEVLRMSTSRKVEEMVLKKCGTKCFSNPGLVECFLMSSVKSEVESDSQSSFEVGLAVFSDESPSGVSSQKQRESRQ